MSTSLPVNYAHTTRYFNKGIDARGPYYRVEYLIDNYSDVDTVVNAMMGRVTLTGGVLLTGTTITAVTPHQHPLSPNLWCTQADALEGLGAPALNALGYPGYSGGALIRAEYRAPMTDYVSAPENSFDPGTPILWATQELDFGSEMYTIPNAQYTYKTPAPAGIINQPCGVPVKIRIAVTTMVLTYERLPFLVMVATRALRGRVNSSTFLGSSAGQVLFSGARTSRSFNTDGSIAQKTQLVFQERDSQYPWNNLPNQTDLNWYPVQDGSGNTIYPTADLTPLVAFF